MSNLPGLLFYSERVIFRLLRHLFLFISMILLFSWVVQIRDEQGRSTFEIISGVFLNSIFFFGYAYITAYILLPKLLSKKHYFFFATSFILSGLLISYLKFLFSDYIFYSAIAADMSGRLQGIEFSQVIVNTKDMTFIVAIFLIAKFTKDNHHLKIRLRELQDQQIRTEIKVLKNQLDSHVVFNNLNNIYSLALNNSASVAENIHRLKSVLSYFFIDGKEQCIPLEKELQTIEDYISLEKLRYGERLSKEFKIYGDSSDKFIVPFVLFSFVENCFEHGCSIDSGMAWIRIEVKIERDSLIFHASNSKPGNILVSDDESHKHSYKSMKNKLELLYPGKYLLRIDDRVDKYFLDLKLKF